MAKKHKLWFDKELAEMLADKILVEKADFNKKSFVKSIDSQVNMLELKARIEVFADELHQYLSANYEQAMPVLMKILGPENEEETGMFTNFYWIMPIAFYVEKYGLNHFDLSMEAIREVTKRNTSEYAIRPYLEQYPDKTLKMMKKWSKDKNFHVRRLSCEGVRPRLPWAKKLDQFIENPAPILPILENLKDDKSKYVQKSVANCINDIVKDNRAVAENLIESWRENAGKERKWIIKHSLRKLLKAGDAWAIEMIV
ncbi:MAG: DNA alkylation repair protein [Bacteroidota bacterium]